MLVDSAVNGAIRACERGDATQQCEPRAARGMPHSEGVATDPNLAASLAGQCRPSGAQTHKEIRLGNLHSIRLGWGPIFDPMLTHHQEPAYHSPGQSHANDRDSKTVGECPVQVKTKRIESTSGAIATRAGHVCATGLARRLRRARCAATGIEGLIPCTQRLSYGIKDTGRRKKSAMGTQGMIHDLLFKSTASPHGRGGRSSRWSRHQVDEVMQDWVNNSKEARMDKLPDRLSSITLCERRSLICRGSHVSTQMIA
ncbi:uncharacterized protein LAESUDRAFT_751597 [Laetiporus sulphureus 93-53]|uniref:Uncharacterized protein n=1 Tax=Laetiporus sulphureus 93-53 TaxID=1314785 RepID=A0A165CW24_9APHY|nr:uncharacterized protein LAESUDRAFT_751597 [Laetiporus sulphureus 93-53]KZT03550.1 hypothetical protein LAESUDRAFT_751597 [Laetiporus sulphureus 93-53]